MSERCQFPKTTDEAQAFVSESRAKGRKLIAAGTMKRLSLRSDFDERAQSVLSAGDLNRVVSVEPENLLVIAEAGVTASQLNQALADTGLYWPVTGLERRSLGGIMGEGALGLETMMRGPMTDWVLGVTFIDAAGRLISSGGRTLKNVSGYDFTRLHWRAGGALGFCLSFVLKLLPCPQVSRTLEFSLADGAVAAEAAERFITGGIQPEGIFILTDNDSVRLCLWLTGFEETMAARCRKAIDLVGGDPESEREGRPSWDASANSPAKDKFEYIGSRRDILSLARCLNSGDSTGLTRACLDVGGGRAGLTFAAGCRPDGQLVSGLSPDSFNSRGTVYDLLKKGLDSEGLFVALED